jgi:acetylornithine deacetylase
MEPSALAAQAIDTLARLIAFDTTSRNSNLALIDWAEGRLRDLGAETLRIAAPGEPKANLVAVIGPKVEGGVLLSGHTDVVPVDGQPWSTPPFEMTQIGDRLFGRGTADMKAFLALMLAAAPALAEAPLKRPAILAFTYDEEIGCLGAPGLIARLAEAAPRPALAIVGEPTSMRVVQAHKSILYHEVTIRGREAHSSQPHLGASANMAAARIMGALAALAERLDAEADPASPFTPKGASLTIGVVNGGTAPNILALDCRFVFDIRAPLGLDLAPALAEIEAMIAHEDAAMRARTAEGFVRMTRIADVPAFDCSTEAGPIALVQRLAGDNGRPASVSYGAEAGQYQAAGIPTVLCGPGSIDQAHQPDEFIDVSQIERGAEMMSRILAELCA